MSILTSEFGQKVKDGIKHYGHDAGVAVTALAGVALFGAGAIAFAKGATFCFMEGGEAVYKGADWAINKANCAFDRPNCRRG